jgi:hypothetical protein
MYYLSLGWKLLTAILHPEPETRGPRCFYGLPCGKAIMPTRSVNEGKTVPRLRSGLGLKQQAGERGDAESLANASGWDLNKPVSGESLAYAAGWD